MGDGEDSQLLISHTKKTHLFSTIGSDSTTVRVNLKSPRTNQETHFFPLATANSAHLQLAL